MNECKAIHETSIGAVLDIIKDVKDTHEEAKKNKTEKSEVLKNRAKSDPSNPMKGMTSLAKLDSNLTLVFPVLCSKGISIENACMISKAMEKYYVSMLQRIFTAYQLVEKDEHMNAIDFIKKFHSNLDSRLFSIDDLGRFYEQLEFHTTTKEPLTSIEESAIRADMRNINFILPSDVNESSLSRFSVCEGVNSSIDIDVIREADGDEKYTLKPSDPSNIRKNTAEYFSKQVPDSEYKKANELMPTSMNITFKNKETGVANNDALIAVKAKLYPVASEEVVDNISKRMEDKNWITSLVRASTREISFFKDFLFAIDRAKIDALSGSIRKKSTDKIWKVLERRSTASKTRRAMQSNNSGTAAITTLCISQEEVEYLRKHHNVDMERISTVRAMFDALNLIAIVIVDESLEVAKFAFDEQDPSWETISFTHLERESNDNTYKRVVNLMTKVSR